MFSSESKEAKRQRARDRVARGKVLEPARKAGRAIWAGDKTMFPSDLQDKLKLQGFDIILGTCSTWLRRWHRQEARATKAPQQVAHPVKQVPRAAIGTAPLPPELALMEHISQGFQTVISLSREAMMWREKALEWSAKLTELQAILARPEK